MAEATAPTTAQVAFAIARREMSIALRRRLVKLLFLANLVPPLVMAVVLVVRTMVEGVGFNLGWDPLGTFMMVQIGPVLLLALAIGTPAVARDRGEDVLFLYATRPVTALSYTLGKLAAVAVPAAGLLFIPGILIAVVRLGILDDVRNVDAAVLLAKVLLVAVFMAVGYAGVCVGASAAAKKARWALLAAFAAIAVPRMSAGLVTVLTGVDIPALDAPMAVQTLVDNLFDGSWTWEGAAALAVLVAWGTIGAGVTAVTVGREMTP